MNDFENYANYFSVGMKVGVGIPLANAGVFRDWAIISEIDEDLVSLQLSRDQFPLNVSLHVGQILDLRGGKDDSGYSCRAIIVAESPVREILLRLIGEIVSDELRSSTVSMPFCRSNIIFPLSRTWTRSSRNGRIAAGNAR